jgi:hypothetical protein
MRTSRAAIYLVMALACSAGAPAAAQDLLEQVPTDSVVVRGTYSVLANCIYGRLDETGLKKADLQNEIRLTLESGATRYWQLTLAPERPGFTRASLTRVQTIFGPMRAPKVMPAVQACAAE